MRRRSAWGLSVGAGLLVLVQSVSVRSAPPPVEELLRRVVEHAHEPGKAEPKEAYVCTKQTVTEQLDPQGRVTEKKVRVGESHSGSGTADANNWSSKNGFRLDADLLRRYRFTYIGTEAINGREAYVLTFVPKQPPAPVHHFQDHLLNRAMGTVWVDEEDYGLIKADICLGQAVSFGILGAIDEFSFSFERERAGDGDWITLWTDTFIKARKFLKPIQTHKRVEWRDFKKENNAGFASVRERGGG